MTPDRLTVPAHLMDGAPGDHYLLKVVGNSMAEDGILDGDFIICLRAVPRDGDVCVVAGGDGALISRVTSDGSAVRLRPPGPDRKSIHMPAGNIEVQAVVVGLMRKFPRGEVAP